MWLGIGEAISAVIDQGGLEVLKEMHNEWPFFRVTLDMIKMVFGKADPAVFMMYAQNLSTPDMMPMAEALIKRFELTSEAIDKVTGRCYLLCSLNPWRHLQLCPHPLRGRGYGYVLYRAVHMILMPGVTWQVLNADSESLSLMKGQSELNLKLMLRAPYVTPLNALQVRQPLLPSHSIPALRTANTVRERYRA